MMNIQCSDDGKGSVIEIEEIIEEVRNDVEDTGTDLISNMEFQDQSCKKLSVAMNKLTKELQQHGECLLSYWIPLCHVSAEKERRNTDQKQRELKMKILTDIKGTEANLNKVKKGVKCKDKIRYPLSQTPKCHLS